MPGSSQFAKGDGKQEREIPTGAPQGSAPWATTLDHSRSRPPVSAAVHYRWDQSVSEGAVMQVKLTLRLDEKLVRRAKNYARRTGKSVSSLVADYLSQLSKEADASPERLSPAVRSLVGALAGHKVDEEDYLRHRLEQHR